MLVVLWIWQDAVSNYTVKTLPYSEFKQHLRQGEVIEARLSPDQIDGKIVLQAVETNAVPAESNLTTSNVPGTDEKESGEDPNSFMFRTVRVEDPKLVEEMEAAEVKFTGLRPSFLSQFLMAWILPIGIMILIWSFIARKMSGGASSLLSIGKNKARILVDKNTGVTFEDVAGCD